jgi:hypothetical protein
VEQKAVFLSTLSKSMRDLNCKLMAVCCRDRSEQMPMTGGLWYKFSFLQKEGFMVCYDCYDKY